MILVPPEPETPDVSPPNTRQAVQYEVKKRLKLWVVMRDDVYTGSYPDEASAEAAGQKHVDAIIRGGGKAKLVHATGE